jgi:predicted nuclease of restriction endonuclease-like (RecB) superfamily
LAESAPPKGRCAKIRTRWTMAIDHLSTGYEDFLRNLKDRIRAAQVRAALAVNSELVLLYWQIGRDILERQEREGWGTKVIDRLSGDLRREFPEMKGVSPRNLQYMRAFAQAWPDESIVQEVLAQITWPRNPTFVQQPAAHISTPAS